MDEGDQGLATSASAETNADETKRPIGAQVSRAMVNVYKTQFGRGPVKAHTHWAGSDMLVCVLEDSLTPAEINLRKLGEHARLRDLRTLFQYSSVKDFVDPVEEITGREVRAFLSGIDVANDVSTETFLFVPQNGEPDQPRDRQVDAAIEAATRLIEVDSEGAATSE
jgi:uncharacterized protein YbcI